MPIPKAVQDKIDKKLADAKPGLVSEEPKEEVPEPDPVVEPVAEVVEEIPKGKSTLDGNLRRIQNILAQYNYIESDIPIGDEYWGLKTRYRKR